MSDRAIPVLRTRHDLDHWRSAGNGALGFVPTMGALHAGHLALVRRGVRENERALVSIFVNPSQFGPGEDFERYPRDLDADLKTLARIADEGGRSARGQGLANPGCLAVFSPQPGEIYPPDDATWIEVAGVSEPLCGRFRPGHFRGVATVVHKLLRLTRPDRAYFGEKDWQQLQVIRRMAKDLELPAEIVGCPTVREADGLAMSSRNAYLSRDERAQATRLVRALEAIRDACRSGERDVLRLVRAGHTALGAPSARESVGEPTFRVQYLEIREADSLAPLERVEPGTHAIAAGAIVLGGTRLIDNVLLS